MSKKHLVVLILLMALCACSKPSETAIQTAIAQTQSAEDIFPTVQTDLEADLENETTVQDCALTTPYHEDWPVVFCDTFDDNRNNWEVGSDSGDLSQSILAIEDGKLVVDLSGKNNSGYLTGVIQWFYVGDSRDFVITLKGDVFSKYKSHSWGIIFNEESNQDFAAFMISSSDGSYYLTRYEDGEQKFPIPGKSNGAIVWDEQNELTIVAEDGYCQFYINGEFVNDYEADDIPGTNIAIAIWTAEGATARFEFDDLLIKTPAN